MRRVLVLWADDRSANLGVRALAEGAGAVAAEVWPHCEIQYQDFAPNAEGFALGRAMVTRQLTHRAISTWLDSFDVVLDTGAGDSFADIYGFKRFAMMTVTQRARIASGRPIVLLPQTIGPFRTRAARRLAALTLESVDAVYARDPASLDAARALVEREVGLASDLVFALPREDPHLESDVLVNVSGLLWTSDSHVSAEKYRQQTRELIGGLELSGRSVTLLPHVLANPSQDNDLLAVADLVKDFPHVEVAEVDSLATARGVIAGARLVVGARMHACLNALSQGVPAIPWAYSRKFEPLLGHLGWRHTVSLGADLATAADRTLEIVAKTSDIELSRDAHHVAGAGERHARDLVASLREVAGGW